MDMKILICGDKHLKFNRFNDSIKFLKWFEDIARETNPDWIVSLGDDFDSHAILRSEILSEYRKHIDSLVAISREVYFLVGNHDCYKPSDIKYHALQSFKDIYSNLTIVDKRIDIDNFTFTPYIHDTNNFPTDTKEICFTHNMFMGSDSGNMRFKSGIDSTKIDAEIIISGHIHMKQTVGKVFYPGTPFSHNADDIDQIKGVHLFDTDNYSFKFFESPLPKWRSLKINLQENKSDIYSKIESISINDWWILDITGPKAEIRALIDSKKYKEISKNKNIQIKDRPTDSIKKNKTVSVKSVDSALIDYFDNVYTGSIDKDVLKSKSLDLLSKNRNKSEA